MACFLARCVVPSGACAGLEVLSLARSFSGVTGLHTQRGTAVRMEFGRRRVARRLVVRRLSAVMAAVVVASMVAAVPVAAQEDAVGGFSDVPEGVHKPAIDALAAMGVFEGTECAQGMFCPGDEMKRWTMGVWLVRVLDEAEPLAVSESSFADVESDEWWLAHVERLAELEVTKGCKTEPLRFCPDQLVTRAQMATFLVRAFDLEAAEPAGLPTPRATPMRPTSMRWLRPGSPQAARPIRCVTAQASRSPGPRWPHSWLGPWGSSRCQPQPRTQAKSN